ncbi:MAG: hypothetical protein K2X66_07600 [Cyanobacteria bacterium]|nr:hypothetical protein [Cyanobacteriota bacterium]
MTKHYLSKASNPYKSAYTFRLGVSLIETALCMVLIFVTIFLLVKTTSGPVSTDGNVTYGSSNQQLGVKNKTTLLANSLVEDVLAGRFTETDPNRIVLNQPGTICSIPIGQLRTATPFNGEPGLPDSAYRAINCQDNNSSVPIIYRWEVRRLFFGNNLARNTNVPCSNLDAGCFRIATRSSIQAPNASYNEYYLANLTFFRDNASLNADRPSLIIPLSFAVNNFVPDPVNANVLLSIAFDAVTTSDTLPGGILAGTVQGTPLFVERDELIRFLSPNSLLRTDPFLSKVYSRVTAFGIKGFPFYGPLFNGQNQLPTFYSSNDSPSVNLLNQSFNDAEANVKCFGIGTPPPGSNIEAESQSCNRALGRGMGKENAEGARLADHAFTTAINSHQTDNDLPNRVGTLTIDPRDYNRVAVVILNGDDGQTPLGAAPNFPTEATIASLANQKNITLFTIGFVTKQQPGDPDYFSVNTRLRNLASQTRFGMNFEAPSNLQFSNTLQSIVSHNQVFALMKKMRRYGVDI